MSDWWELERLLTLCKSQLSFSLHVPGSFSFSDNCFMCRACGVSPYTCTSEYSAKDSKGPCEYLHSPLRTYLLSLGYLVSQIPGASTSPNPDVCLSPHFSEAAMLSLQLPSLYYRRKPEKSEGHPILFPSLRNQSSARLLFTV